MGPIRANEVGVGDVAKSCITTVLQRWTMYAVPVSQDHLKSSTAWQQSRQRWLAHRRLPHMGREDTADSQDRMWQ